MFGTGRHFAIRLQTRVLRRLSALAGHGAGPPRSRARQPAHLVTGTVGEREALLHLRSLGYTVVARRWTTGKLRGDLDLVAWQGDTLCFIEVKTRREQNPLDPAEAAINREKRVMLRRMAGAYLRAFPQGQRSSIAVRFDVVAVYLLADGPRIEVFPHAFGWHDAPRASPARFGV